MPKVLFAGNPDLAPLLRGTVLWGRDVERVVASSADAALDVARGFVPSLVVVDGSNPTAAHALVCRLRMHAGTRRSSIVVASCPVDPTRREQLRAAGANLVLSIDEDATRFDAELASLMAVPRRVRVSLPVWLQPSQGQPPLRGAGLDVSPSGLLVEVPVALAVGTYVGLRIELPGAGGAVRTEGSVVRSVAERPPRLGIRIDRFLDDAEARLRAFVSSMPGPQTFGRYESLGLLGEGSMGRVFKAFDPATQRVIAVKTLRAELLADRYAEENLRRFHREVRAAAQLHHPNVVTIFDVGDSYFVMELLEGTTLENLLRARACLVPGETCAVLGPVAQALDHAHGCGTIHRDVKPANIMLTSAGQPKLMDFGIAHVFAASITTPGHVLGSPDYLSPEQISGAEATPRSDQFSLGVVAYEALTAHMPFEAASLAESLFAIVEREAPAASSFRPEIPVAVDAVLARALAKDPAARFPSTTAFVEALAASAVR